MTSMSENANASLVAAAEDFLAAAKAFNGEPMGQMALVKKADKLRYLSEGPRDTIFRQWDTIHLTAAINIVKSTGVLDEIPKKGTITAKELSEAVNLHESVVARSMRILCVQGICDEPEPDIYSHNAKSLVYITAPSKYFFDLILDQDYVFKKLPQYLKDHSTSDLMDLKKSPYAYAYNRMGMSYYEVISDDPVRFEMFNQSIRQMDQQMPVLGMFPFASLKEQVEADTSRPFIVDVGGGLGAPLMSIQKEAPAGFGAKCILQDRKDVLDSIKDEDIPNVEKMEHDFFTPQPVKNAHVYLLRRILHDFYMPVCKDIVRNIASAMGKDSRLLIGDFVVPEKTNVGDDLMVYWMDFSMMVLTGQEKTAKQFAEILEDVGLELVKIWRYPYGAQAVVEAKLKQ
ncbi:o-methyltransferas-like protein [Pseudovirgaria hyperparasitica]|uniref:O-methyltransferas-like protein n=1 Tax=Pseudovirgaria hyperparasitica TaxID=470096 RepID=A0A6A6WLR3_9PEZI|nr:o-methyltransferas-like protein [Pseudovirgaria hyperparasitica]KAF2763086.1 o-methyltransferas-like protein [Pseudovirgaria hyperparasitica]